MAKTTHERNKALVLEAFDTLFSPPDGSAGPPGRGLMKVPALSGSPRRGAAIFAAQCASCHGSEENGVGLAFPPLWGPESFNDGAGMDGVVNIAAFVVRNMPPTSPGSLTPQRAFDVSSYIHTKPRHKYNPAFDKY
jgi:thiosulfate dehydrogenase